MENKSEKFSEMENKSERKKGGKHERDGYRKEIQQGENKGGKDNI